MMDTTSLSRNVYRVEPEERVYDRVDEVVDIK